MTSGKVYTYDEVKSKIESFCVYQDRSEYEVLRKMDAWSLDADTFKHIIEHLKKNRFLDNERFAKSFVSGKFNIKKWGKLKIKSHLILHRIDQKTILNSLKEIDDVAYMNCIQLLAQQKMGTLRSESDNLKRKIKCMSFLQSRGFEYDLIQEAIKNLENY